MFELIVFFTSDAMAPIFNLSLAVVGAAVFATVTFRWL